MTTPSPLKYSKMTIALHWLGALLIIGLLVVGQMMEDMTGADKLQLLTVHMYVGIATGVIFLLRLVFFFVNARPAEDPAWPKWQVLSSKAVHGLLYLMPLIMVASGMIAMSIFGLKDFVDAGDFEGYESAHRIAPMFVHGIVAKLLFASVVLHILAALYHQFVQKDKIFSRIMMRG